MYARQLARRELSPTRAPGQVKLPGESGVVGVRAIVIYSAEGHLDEIAKGVASGIESTGARVQLLRASEAGATVPLAPFDLVCVGSPSYGLVKTRIASDVAPLLKKCTRMEGKAAAAFVTPKAIGTATALKILMALLESQGARVGDFSALRDKKTALEFGHRICTLPANR
ncbi:MAG: DNA-binding response regulator [Firmicutes bacterium]|nr:DNA-binding response regulator [Bacillota bacterium]